MYDILKKTIITFSLLQTLVVKMEKYVWLMELPLQEEWRFVWAVYGEQCVTTFGMIVMLELYADTLDLWMNVSIVQKVHL